MSGSRAQTYRPRLLLHQFDPPVLGTAVLVVVWANGRRHADTRRLQPRRGDPVRRRQCFHDRGGPPFRQSDVVVERADVVRVSDPASPINRTVQITTFRFTAGRAILVAISSFLEFGRRECGLLHERCHYPRE